MLAPELQRAGQVLLQVRDHTQCARYCTCKWHQWPRATWLTPTIIIANNHSKCWLQKTALHPWREATPGWAELEASSTTFCAHVGGERRNLRQEALKALHVIHLHHTRVADGLHYVLEAGLTWKGDWSWNTTTTQPPSSNSSEQEAVCPRALLINKPTWVWGGGGKIGGFSCFMVAWSFRNGYVHVHVHPLFQACSSLLLLLQAPLMCF